MAKIISLADMLSEMSQDEYSSFLEKQKEKGYSNDAKYGEDGEPIDVNDYILAGMDVLINATAVAYTVY